MEATADLGALKALLGDRIILPADENFQEERKLYNGMIDKNPSVIVKCADVADVITAVDFARENNLLVAIRGGGHNGGGLGSCDNGLVIDLSGIKYIRVNPADNTVRVGGGNLWGEVDHATHAFGLAVPSGTISTTGVAGLTLGGGIGHLTRKYGLTIDNLLEVDMVLADGSFVTANTKQNVDLFWAVRGGGGNFGIVTSFKFQGHLLKNVIAGPTLWPIEKTGKILQWYDDFIANAPDELNGFAAIMSIPESPFPQHLHNEKFCGIMWCYAGDDEEKFEKLMKPVRAMEPYFEHLGLMPYPSLQTFFDGLFTKGMQWYWRGEFFTEIGPEAREIHEKFGLELPSAHSLYHLYPINGAAGRVKNEDTAWAFRDAKYAGVCVGVDGSAENAEKITSWCKSYSETLRPYSLGAGYVNFQMDEGEDKVKATYRDNYKRLVAIKNEYDPENFFRVNQNIKPQLQK